MRKWLIALALGLALLGAAACGGGGPEPEDFAEFADQIARAVERGDTAFFTDRIEGVTHTCTEEEVAVSTGPDAPSEAICLEVGFQFESIYIQSYPGAGQIKTPENLIRDIEQYFQDDLSDEEDSYGSGTVQLYATAIPSSFGEESGVHSAILTAIHKLDVNVTGRTARGIDFEYVNGRWVIRGELGAGPPLAIDLLEPSIAILVYTGWTAY